MCVQAARTASSAAVAAQQQMPHQESREPLPAFGSGIQFRPTKKAKQQGLIQNSQKSAAVSNLALDDGSDDVDVQMVSIPVLVSFECDGKLLSH